jgi:hypothetical protein
MRHDPADCTPVGKRGPIDEGKTWFGYVWGGRRVFHIRHENRDAVVAVMAKLEAESMAEVAAATEKAAAEARAQAMAQQAAVKSTPDIAGQVP